MYSLICSKCGNSFKARYKDVKICDDCKKGVCEICGKAFVKVWPYTQRCCSSECHKKFMKSDTYKKECSERKLGLREIAPKKERKVETKLCKYCGKPFDTDNELKIFCDRDHYATCKICGSEFKVTNLTLEHPTCSRKCGAIYRKQNLVKKIRVCEICGNKFISDSSTAKYCNGPHFKNCEVCGKPFDVTRYLIENVEPPKTCSIECAKVVREATNLATYGFKSPTQTPEAREKFRKQALANESQREQTNLERYGFRFASQHPDMRKRLSEATLSEEVKEKTRNTTRERYGVDYAMQNLDIVRRVRESKGSAFACDGTALDSSWEKIFYDFLYRNNISFEYNNVQIPFEYEGKDHMLFVDFKVGDLLFEVKGDHLLEGYRYATEIPISKKLELYKKYHIIVVCGSNVNGMFGKPESEISHGLKYLNKCPEPLIGVDIGLFSNPKFPFREDRPACFYKVKVDGERSSLEAFYDEKIRWNMILNRIQYTGGFIDAKQVLRAMNVTRTCKQPSWFTKKRAVDIIKEHCSSEVIVDTFAGWGTRCDAAAEMHRNYIGIDLNPEVVKWHEECGRNVKLGDARYFKYDGKCSVFICPPYSDPDTGKCSEDYNFKEFDEEVRSIGQCEWLKITMRNVPNASEYVMVCKLVDPEFQPYIIDTIQNKSHFGTNSEYIVKVPAKDRYTILQGG